MQRDIAHRMLYFCLCLSSSRSSLTRLFYATSIFQWIFPFRFVIVCMGVCVKCMSKDSTVLQLIIHLLISVILPFVRSLHNSAFHYLLFHLIILMLFLYNQLEHGLERIENTIEMFNVLFITLKRRKFHPSRK